MATDTNTNQANDTKVTFDEKQQERINELIREAQGRAAKEVRTELDTIKSAHETLQSELNAAKTELSKAKTPGEKKEAKGDIEALQNQIDEMKRARENTVHELENLKRLSVQKDNEIKGAKDRETNFRKQVALTKAAEKVNPFSVDQIVKLSGDAVVWSDQRQSFVVTDPNTGQERMNSGYEPMSLDEYFTEVAAKNPNLVRSTAKTGTGSTESTRYDVSNSGKYTLEQLFGPKSNAALVNRLSFDDPAEYKRMRNMAIDNGMVIGKKH